MAKKKEKAETKDAGAKPKKPRAKKAAPTEAEKLAAEIKELGAKLVAAANSPVGREVIAAGLTIAATAAAASRVKRKSPGAEEGTTRAPDPEAIASAIGSVAETVLSKLFGKS